MPARDRVSIRRDQGDPAVRLLYPRERDRGHALKVLISAAEASSDAHGAELLRALRAESRSGDQVDAFGVGGPRLKAEGLRALVDARELLAMGFGEVLGRLPRVWSALRELTDEAERERPDVAIVIDYPDFHFRLARRLRKLGIPVIYYIPPKVWVWRKGRIRELRDSFAKVLSILPFEVPFYEREKVPVTYVGNPLADELPLGLRREQARIRLKIADDAQVLTLMPGSRPSEIRHHLEVMLDGANRAAAVLRASRKLEVKQRLVVLVPFPMTSDLAAVSARVSSWARGASGGNPDFILDIRVSQGNAAECLVAADAGLIKSGTSTLEAALLGCPHSIVYKTNRLTEWIFKLFVRYSGPVGLTNLVAQDGVTGSAASGKRMLVREVLLSDVTVPRLSDEIVSLMTDEERRAAIGQGLAWIREKLLGEALVAGGARPSPSRRAAREVLGVVFGRGAKPIGGGAGPGVGPEAR